MLRRRDFESQWVIAACAAYFTTVMNVSFWRFVTGRLDFSTAGSALFALSMPVVLFLVFYVVFSLLAWPYIIKPLVAALTVASAGASYFMFKLNVLIDSEMMRNVFEARPHEISDMVTVDGMFWVALFGIIPAASLIVLVKVRYRPIRRELLKRGIHLAGSLVLLLTLAFLFFKDYAAGGRNNKEAGRLLNPFNYITSTRSYFRKRARKNLPFIVIDEAPKHVPYEDQRLTVLVLMIGEAARAMSFSLNGYERETNPKLARQDIINFPQVAASGTATAFSLPCMFSHLRRKEFDIDSSYRSENLLDLLRKAGYDVIWLDNDGGSKGVSDRVATIDLMKAGNARFKNGDTFFDEVLLDGLEERIANLNKDTVIVLHMMGSHGPGYYRRYPDKFRVFTPACDTAEIQSRPREEILNTYDNTILYSDHVISETIDILKRFPRHEAGMLFVSDHGQSLGENGLYLHGMPYALAPREQTHVPMVLWLSETMRREDYVDYEKLKNAAKEMKLSHDHFFHSILGLLEIDTELYDPALDFFTPFRTKKLPYR
jgi:lipid A ethanolaminephosphotransferase